jgi:hypothetical protein
MPNMKKPAVKKPSVKRPNVKPAPLPKKPKPLTGPAAVDAQFKSVVLHLWC